MAETLIGARELERKLSQLGAKLGTKVLRSAMLKTTTPVLRQMRKRAPVGIEAHRTYRKRLVAPGFLKRSLRRKTRVDKSRGAVVLTMGVRSEAFYGILFYDQGPYQVTKRRSKGTGRSGRQIKAYTLPRRPWFQSTFVANRGQMERGMVDELRKNIDKVTRGN